VNHEECGDIGLAASCGVRRIRCGAPSGGSPTSRGTCSTSPTNLEYERSSKAVCLPPVARRRAIDLFIALPEQRTDPEWGSALRAPGHRGSPSPLRGARRLPRRRRPRPRDLLVGVERNLEKARLRLVFIADAIPPELARIVAFLDERLEGIDVLAFEIRRYKDAETGLEALVPRQIAGARTKAEATTGEPRRWDEQTFFAEIESRAGTTAAATARRLFAWAGREGFASSWGAGARTGTFGVKLETSAGRVSFFHVTTKGTVQLVFDHLARLPPYRTEAARWALAQEINRATGASIREDQMNEWASIDLELLAAPAAFAAFCGIYKRLGEEARRPEASAGA